MWVSIRPTPGGFSTCTGMLGSGFTIGRQIISEVLKSTRGTGNGFVPRYSRWFLVRRRRDPSFCRRVNNIPGNRYTTLGFVLLNTCQPIRRILNWNCSGAAITREAGRLGRSPASRPTMRDGNITDQIVVTGTVDMNSTGTYLHHLYRTGRRR